MKNLPKEIVHVYIVSGILIAVSLILGIIFSRPELYLAFPLGGITALFNLYLLSREVYRMVYVRENIKARNPLGFLIRMSTFAAGMLAVAKITEKYYPDKMAANIIFTGLGFMIFKISLILVRKKGKHRDGQQKKGRAGR